MITIEPLRTILQLECQRNYTDAAVIGGLDRYLFNWATKTRDRISSPSLLAHFDELQLATPSYGTWDTERRKAWVKAVQDWLADVEESTKTIPSIKNATSSVKSAHRLTASQMRSSGSDGNLDSSLTVAKGITANMATRLAKLGVKTIRDLLYFFPRRHLDYSQSKSIAELKEGEEQTILATVWEARIVSLGNHRGTEVVVGDATGNIRAVWFNQPYLAKGFPSNAQMVLSGRVAVFKGQKVFESPEWEMVEDKALVHTGRLVPVYPLTRGLYPRQVRNLVKRVIDVWAWQISDFLPQEIKSRRQLLDLPEAIVQTHYPDSYLLKAAARKRLAFDELFLIQLGVLDKKRDWQQSQPGNAFVIDNESIENFISGLPFVLTHAQQRVLKEILADLERARPMSRLLQGEVGSGKTVVAAAALLAAGGSGYQGALMAPTEILAEQHFHNICQLLSSLSSHEEDRGSVRRYHGVSPRCISLALLTGGLNEKEKDALHQQTKEGNINIVIGTHALIQKGVEFHKLGLAVIDEQHRFGVLQRATLRQKGFNPHILIMTATPIPRTLALTLYGDLDLSIIDELPPGRQVIKTNWLGPEYRDRAYNFLRRQVVAGQQAFIICPFIEESESIEAKAAVAEYERLSREVFPDFKLGLLHGRLSSGDKEEVMQNFRSGRLDILVSTPVVEVGIDVPNATVMLVEAADRFGLSQLHQFRGRVGRGEQQSFCLLLAESPSPEGRERLRVIEEIQDGFALAEKDLELRGPGEFFGTRQSGLPDLRMARLTDMALLESARDEAISLFQNDPELEMPEYNLLRQEMTRVWQSSGEWS